MPKLKIPPSEATRKYPVPFGPVIMPITGLFSTMPPVLPWNWASPYEKIPPSDATSQYPWPLGVAAIPTTGWLSLMAPVLP